MWFGTQDGLNKYDGNKIIVFKSDPRNSFSITNNFIRCICEDRKKNLWLGTNNGFSRYDREKNLFLNYHTRSENKIKGLPDTVIRTIYEDRIGNLWIGTYGDGLYKFIEEENIFINYCKNVNYSGSLTDNRVTAIF